MGVKNKLIVVGAGQNLVRKQVDFYISIFKESSN